MSISLTPGFSGYVTIQDVNGNELYKKDIAEAKEIKEFVKTYGKSVPGWSFALSLFFSLRRDNVSDAAKDLFFPTFFNYAQKVNNIALRIFLSVLALAADVITLPCRLITAPFMAIFYYAKPRQQHPLEELIKDVPKSQEAINSGLFKIKAHFESIEIEDVKEQLQDVKEKKQPLWKSLVRKIPHIDKIKQFDDSFKNAKQVCVDSFKTVAIKALPSSMKESGSEKRVAKYVGYKGDWTLDTAVTLSPKKFQYSK